MELIETRANAKTYQDIDAIRKELQQVVPWLFLPGFNIGPNQGYFGDGRLFGACAGLSHHMNTSNVLHEVGHAIEMTLQPTRVWKRRVKQDEFGIAIKTYQDVMGRRYFEPVTMQPTERECRVGGIQLRLLEAAGYDTSEFIEEFVLVMCHMPDSCFGGRSPMNTHDPERYTPDMHDWVNLRTRLVKDAYDQFPLEDIQRRWTKVMTYLHSVG